MFNHIVVCVCVCVYSIIILGISINSAKDTDLYLYCIVLYKKKKNWKDFQNINKNIRFVNVANVEVQKKTFVDKR